MELIVIGLIGLAVLLVARGGVAETITSGLAPLVFALLVAVAVAAIWMPAPYEALADWGLRAAGLQQRLEALDDAVPIDSIKERSADVFGRLGDLLGRAPAVDEGPSADAADAPGLVERSLYPGLVAAIALVLRGAALGVSLAGMLATVALGWAAGAVRAGRRARENVLSLEARVAALERREDGGRIAG